MVGHIYIYGEIFTDGISLKSVVDAFNLQKHNEYNIHIHSIGGCPDEAFAIYDFLKSSGKKITTINEGNCYSAASIIYFAGSERLTTKNADFLFHYPFGTFQGTSKELTAYAEKLKQLDGRLIKLYTDNTNIDAENLKSLMGVEQYIMTDEAIRMGIANKVVEPLKAIFKN